MRKKKGRKRERTQKREKKLRGREKEIVILNGFSAGIISNRMTSGDFLPRNPELKGFFLWREKERNGEGERKRERV